MNKNVIGYNYLHKLCSKLLDIRSKNHLLRTIPDSSKLFTNRFDQDYFYKASALLSQKLLQTDKLSDLNQLNLNSNDYLGVSRSKIFNIHDIELAKNFPLGSHSSRLLGGNHPIFELLETQARDLLGFEQCLFVPSGTIANNSLAQLFRVLADISGEKNTINFFSDRLNHASTIDGISYAKGEDNCKLYIFNHLDLKDLLKKIDLVDRYSKLNIIFCEGLYSMDSDGYNLDMLIQILLNKKNILVLDEAFSIAINYPNHHLTLASALFQSPKIKHHYQDKYSLNNLRKKIIGIYPLGKSLGINGALVGISQPMKSIWINFARSFIYSTAPSPLIAASIVTRLLALEHITQLSDKLSSISIKLYSMLSQEIPYQVYGYGNQIITIIVKDPKLAVFIADHLKTNSSIYLSAIRYPTVDHHLSRVRLIVHPFLKDHDLTSITNGIKQAIADFK